MAPEKYSVDRFPEVGNVWKEATHMSLEGEPPPAGGRLPAGG
jgi:hypothetical protein